MVLSHHLAGQHIASLPSIFIFLIALTPACNLNRTISWEESVNLLSGESLAIAIH
jgi:hypothetical protein